MRRDHEGAPHKQKELLHPGFNCPKPICVGGASQGPKTMTQDHDEELDMDA